MTDDLAHKRMPWEEFRAAHHSMIEKLELTKERLEGRAPPPDDLADAIPIPPPDVEAELAREEPSSLTLATPIVTGVALAKPLPPLPYLVRELAMPSGAGAPHMLGGYGFSGKSVAAQALVLALAAELPIFGVYGGPGARLRVLHLDHEQGLALTQTRYQRIARTLGVRLEDLDEHLNVVSFPKLSNGSLLVLDAAHRSIWRDLMSGRDLLLVDSFAAARDNVISENDAGARRAVDLLGELAEETKCRSLLIAHASKPAQDDRGAERDARFALRGSGAIFDACDSVYILSGAKAEAVKLQQVKARSHGEPIADLALVIADVERDGDPRWGLRVSVAGVELIAEQREAKAEVRAAKELGRQVDRVRKVLRGGRRLSRTELVSEANVPGKSFSRIWRVLADAGEGAVDVVKDGRTKTHFHYLTREAKP